MVSGRALSFLLVAFNAVLNSTMITLTEQTTFRRSNLVNLNFTNTGDPWQTSSALSCVRKCMDEYSSSCYSVTFNTNTGMCTPRSKVTYNPFGVIGPSEDLFYYTDFCNQTLGFQLFVYETVLQCLYISNDYQDFNTSRQICKDKGARLYIIDSKDKLDLLRSIVHTLTRGRTWIGLTDEATEGKFVWESGQLATSAPFPVPWRPGMPDNMNGDENCCEMGSNGDLNYVNDENCLKFSKYVCEM